MTRSPFLLGVFALLAACGQSEPPVPPPTPRRVKLLTVGQTPAESSIGYAATIRAAQRAELSFPAGGRLEAVLVDTGDPVRAGQVLARLDSAPVRTRAAQARAELARAEAAARDAAREETSQALMLSGDATARRALERAQTNAQQARDAVAAARAALALAERDVDRTVLRAPFAARVVQRGAQRFAEVAAGATVLTLDGVGAREAVAAVPLTRANRLGLGDAATLMIDGTRPVKGRITALSPRAGSGETVDVIVRIDAPALLPGRAARLLVEQPKPDEALALPRRALRLDPTGRAPRVLVAQTDGRDWLLRERRVRVARLPADPDAAVEILAGLRAGERVVVAGVAFLRGGDRVRPFTSQAR